jgi:hypothetical protein
MPRADNPSLAAQTTGPTTFFSFSGGPTNANAGDVENATFVATNRPSKRRSLYIKKDDKEKEEKDRKEREREKEREEKERKEKEKEEKERKEKEDKEKRSTKHVIL